MPSHVRLGRGGPTRQIDLVWRRADTANRKFDALVRAVAAAGR